MHAWFMFRSFESVVDHIWSVKMFVRLLWVMTYEAQKCIFSLEFECRKRIESHSGAWSGWTAPSIK